MADLKEESKWEAGIRQFETTDSVLGGPDGVDNIALRQLGNRTRYLKDELDAASRKIGSLVSDRVAKSGDTMQGRLLGKTGAIAPNNTSNAGFGFDADPDTGMFSPGAGHLQLGAQGVPYIDLLSGNLTLGATGWLSFIAGKSVRGRITSEGRWLVGEAEDNGSALLQVGGVATAAAPPAGDKSDKVITSAWFTAEILRERIGQIVWESRAAPRAGYLILNGAVLNRADYPALWAYVQGSGALVDEEIWSNGNWGSFSNGDGVTTFRIPEFRGEAIRCADVGRGVDAGRRVGTWQDSQNRSHTHGASASTVGDHVHNAWTDAQGWHAHYGWTHAAGSHIHNNGIFSRLLRPPYGGSLTGSDQTGSGAEQAVGVGDSADMIWAGEHGHEFNTQGAGQHGHGVGIAGAGAHSHTISVAADGGAEARMRNVALLAMIRAY